MLLFALSETLPVVTAEGKGTWTHVLAFEFLPISAHFIGQTRSHDHSKHIRAGMYNPSMRMAPEGKNKVLANVNIIYHRDSVFFTTAYSAPITPAGML